ncbi:AAEL017034-PA [Aedes aegypti]|uniref:AAEL017034-PA n=1 Tax=Aedes aegypti TaxID=7159 RepID=J9HIA7_AEDAE|nr:AAEL017034-PA [Aedes aegypti]
MLLCRSSTVIDSKAMIIFHKHSQFLQNMNASLSLHNYFMFHRYRNVSIQRKNKKSSFEMTIFHCDARNLSSPRLSTFVSLENMSEYDPVRLRSLYVQSLCCAVQRPFFLRSPSLSSILRPCGCHNHL